MLRPPPMSTLFPYTTLFRSGVDIMEEAVELCLLRLFLQLIAEVERAEDLTLLPQIEHHIRVGNALSDMSASEKDGSCRDRKSTRLNSSHTVISYAVFCLKKK